MRGTNNITNKITKKLRENGYTLLNFSLAMKLTQAGIYARFRNKNAKFSKRERLICEKYLGKEWEQLIE